MLHLLLSELQDAPYLPHLTPIRQIKFLILDPHYTGKDDEKAVQARQGTQSFGKGKAGGVGWQGLEFFDQDAFYNLCCPQRPNLV